MKVDTRISRQKHQLLLDAGRQLFWKHGFRRVTVEEVCKKAGVSKMTFYRHFGNKIELARAVYERVATEGLARFKEILSDGTATVREKMEAMLQMKAEGTHDISPEFLNDFYSAPESDLPRFVAEVSQRVWAEIILDFRMAQEKGWMRQDFKPEAFLLITSMISKMVSDDQLLRFYDTPQDAVMDLARLFTYGIMPYSK
jgi:AcrR family transcriptional regulator